MINLSSESNLLTDFTSFLMTLQPFLTEFFTEFDKTGIDYRNFELDHLGYRCSSSGDYERVKSELLKFAKLTDENLFRDRRIGILLLEEVIKYNIFEIKIIEIIEPILGEKRESRFEHIEFNTHSPLEDLIKKYPDLDWDMSALHRDQFPMLKLRLSEDLMVKFPKEGMLEQP